MDHRDRHQLTLLLTSPRVAPGLLSASAWDALRAAGTVLAADAEGPVARALAAAGVEVQQVEEVQRRSPQALAGELLGRVASGPVVWVGSPDGDPGLAEALAVALPEEDPPTLELLVASWDVPGARLLDAVAVMDRLRSPGGCPWDAEQTHATLAPYLVEEAHEAVEVLERIDAPAGEPSGEPAGEEGEDERLALRTEAVDELGDVLLQVLFHARVAADDGADPFDVDDVAAALVAKLVRRHPHVFADTRVSGTADVEANWDSIKAAEHPAREHPLDGIPAGMPPLARAAKAASRLDRAGRAEWLAGWVAEQEAAGDPGARLLRLVLELRAEGLDPDAALRQTLRVLGGATRR